MTTRKNDRKLGGRYAFLKRRLLRLPQEPLTIEVDFCPLPHIPGIEYGFWLGPVVDRHSGSMLMETIQEQPPTVEDIADLLAAAMELRAITIIDTPSIKIFAVISSNGQAEVRKYRWPLLYAGFWRAGPLCWCRGHEVLDYHQRQIHGTSRPSARQSSIAAGYTCISV